MTTRSNVLHLPGPECGGCGGEAVGTLRDYTCKHCGRHSVYVGRHPVFNARIWNVTKVQT